jgi:hypothetical protein
VARGLEEVWGFLNHLGYWLGWSVEWQQGFLQNLAKINMGLHSIPLQAHEDKEKRWCYSEFDQREGLVLEWSGWWFGSDSN